MPTSFGKLTIVDPTLAKPIEIDTLTCPHCNTIVPINAIDGTKLHDATGWCFACSKMICAGCAGQACTPFERKLEASERRDRDRRASAEWG